MTDRQEELVAMHALRTLSPEEVRLIESEARYDAKMRETLQEFEEAAGEIARLLTPVAPPDDLRAKILAEVKVRARGKGSAVQSSFRLLRSPIIAWAAAAAIALSAAGLWTRNRQLDQRVVALTQSETAAQGEVAKMLAAKSDVERELAAAGTKNADLAAELKKLEEDYALSRMEVAMMRSSSKKYEETTSLVVWNQEKQEGLLKLENMPSVQNAKDYQLWVICKKCQHPVNAGVVKVAPDGVTTITFKPAHHIEQALKFAISVEAEGGVEEKSPDGPIILASR